MVIQEVLNVEESGNISVTDRTYPFDKELYFRDKNLKDNPKLQFYILTHPVNYGDPFPKKIPYTNWN